MKLFFFDRQVFQLHIILFQFILIIQDFKGFSMPFNQSNGKQWINGIIKSRFPA